MKLLAHICNGPAIPGEILALGSFLCDRWCTKPHMTDGKHGRRWWIEYIREEDGVKYIFTGWAFSYIAVFAFAVNSLYDEIFKICWGCLCGTACSIHTQKEQWLWRTKRLQDCCSMVCLRERYLDWYHHSSHRCGVSSNVVKSPSKTCSMGTLSRL